MNLAELKQRVIFQFNADEDDMGDYEPALDGYINAGYDLLTEAMWDEHLDMGTLLVSMKEDEEVPFLPEWVHIGIADYATYLVYRNGNPQKQNRGLAYLQNFNEILAKCQSMRGKYALDMETGEITVKSKKPPQFINVYP